MNEYVCWVSQWRIRQQKCEDKKQDQKIGKIKVDKESKEKN